MNCNRQKFSIEFLLISQKDLNGKGTSIKIYNLSHIPFSGIFCSAKTQKGLNFNVSSLNKKFRLKTRDNNRNFNIFPLYK